MNAKKAKEIADKVIEECMKAEVCAPPIPGEPEIKIGQAVFVQTVTLYFLGRVVKMDDRFLYIDQCSWIADTGRFHKAMKEGTAALQEIEPLPPERVERLAWGAFIGVSDWPFALPTDAK
jgi:hypothetical protein